MPKLKYLTLTISYTVVSAIALILFSFTNSDFRLVPQPQLGNIEGYVFPKEAKVHIEIVLPRPGNETDTIHRTIVPNSSGYFKIQSIPAGSHELIYWPNDPQYGSKMKIITVEAAKTVKADTVTLQKH